MSNIEALIEVVEGSEFEKGVSIIEFLNEDGAFKTYPVKHLLLEELFSHSNSNDQIDSRAVTEFESMVSDVREYIKSKGQFINQY